MGYKVPSKWTESRIGNSPQGLIDKYDVLIQPCIICKGVHSLMPDLGHVVDSDGLCTSLLWLPPEV